MLDNCCLCVARPNWYCIDCDLNMMLVRVTGVAYVLPRSGKCVANNEVRLISRAGFVLPPHLSYSLFNRQLQFTPLAEDRAKPMSGRMQSLVRCQMER